MNKQLMTVSEVCQNTSLSRSLVYRLIAGGQLKIVKFGRATRIRPEDLQACIEKMARDSEGGR